MSFLLVPDDERDLVRKLCGEFGLQLLLSDLAPGGKPSLARDPLAALPRRLPRSFHDPMKLMFWCPEIGPICTHGDSTPPDNAQALVARELTRQAAGNRFKDVIDAERTPMIMLARSGFVSENCIAPGELQGMLIPVRRQPPELIQLRRRIVYWLKRRARKIDPFDYCSNPGVPRPENPRLSWVWAQPHSWKWIDNSGEVWHSCAGRLVDDRPG